MITSIDIFTGLIAVLVGLTFYAAWRAWVTVVVLEPVVAQLTGSDYREAERSLDRSTRWAGPGTETLASFPDDDTRLTDSYWHYTDAAGERHEVTLSGFVQRGTVPDAARVLWIDPADPSKVTRLGPGFWGLMGIAAAAVLGVLLWRGPQVLARLSAVL